MKKSSNVQRIRNYEKFGLLCIILGSLFAIETYFEIRIFAYIWPFIITITGIGYLGIYIKRNRKEAIFLAIGIYLVLFSLLAVYCTIYTWNQLSFLWPLFLVFMGVTFLLVVLFHSRNRLMLLIGLILVSMSVTFFLVFSLDERLWWLALIFTGISILLTRIKPEKSAERIKNG